MGDAPKPQPCYVCGTPSSFFDGVGAICEPCLRAVQEADDRAFWQAAVDFDERTASRPTDPGDTNRE